MKKKPIKISSGKAKGRRLQNWVCQKISDITGIPWGYEDNKLIQPRIMGQSGVDVVLRDAAQKAFPFSIECKSSETWNIPAAIRQARINKKEDTNWLLVMKRKEFQNPVVILDAEMFFTIYSAMKTLILANLIGKSDDLP
jgi:hypothetical protein